MAPGSREGVVVSTTRDPELEAFKVSIDLRAYAADRGYGLDRKESWRGSSVMRHVNGDKIIVKIDHDRHYVYFSVRDDSDNGSIIDFVQKRGGGSLGAVRQMLRPWIGKRTSAPSLFPELIPTTKDRMEIERLFRMMEDAPRHSYLEKARCVPLDVLSSPRFLGRIKRDKRGNAIFPHFDLEGLCGYEIKNEGYTGFSKGGEKASGLVRRKRMISAWCCVKAPSMLCLMRPCFQPSKPVMPALAAR